MRVCHPQRGDLGAGAELKGIPAAPPKCCCTTPPPNYKTSKRPLYLLQELAHLLAPVRRAAEVLRSRPDAPVNLKGIADEPAPALSLLEVMRRLSLQAREVRNSALVHYCSISSVVAQ